MKQGRVTQLVAETPNMWIHTKINAEGGENEIHKHLDEDHAFIVLEGQMSVFDENGGEIEVKQYQGVMIPKGAYYRYHNTGDGNLVVIRVGAGVKGQQQGGQEMRLGADGKPLVSGTPKNRNLAADRSRHVLRRIRGLTHSASHVTSLLQATQRMAFFHSAH